MPDPHLQTPEIETRDPAVTPMMAQYLEIKAANPDCLLFYRMGDFYELFFDDAAQAAAALDIALTRRGKHRGADIPMCGVPVHSADGYLEKLIRKGFKVAVCEQTEDPAAARRRGGKTVVRRAVARLVTPGTLTEDSLLDARSHNYLAALAATRGTGELALAWLDVSTGDFEATTLARGALPATLARLKPGELLVSEALLQEPDLFEAFGEMGRALTPQPPGRFDSQAGTRRLGELFGVATLDGFGAFTRAERAALGAIVAYVELTQKGRLPLIKPPLREASGETMVLDAATRRNLELDRTLSGERAGSLLSTIDRTVTGAGARLLARRLAAPLTDPRRIDRRLDMVGFFVEAHGVAADIRQGLRACPDIERALSRLNVGRGGPRDLAVIRDGLRQAASLRGILEGRGGGDALNPLPEGIGAALAALGHHAALVGRLDEALGPDLPLLARDGGFIRAGYHAALDELRTLRDESRRVIAALELRYRDETRIGGLKIRHNNVLGYYIEVTAAQADPMLRPPLAATFLHRQTMAGAVRFGSVELSELETRIREAAERALALELQLFDDLVGEVAARATEIAQAARGLAELDVATALAALAVECRHVRPRVDVSRAFRIEGGRHPVVEAALAARGDAPFVANACDLSAEEGGRPLWLLTGPNMAGKSTFLRQNALIAILAQIGAYVPADSAHIGVVDRLFSRVGAADDLARGRSTFMVEMVETAAILNQAGPHALVILDEIGRGTATFDGLSIAWATLEHLHAVNRCRALFATHYHELTALAETLPGLANHTMRVKEWQGDVVFLHEVAAGAADRSYGIQVARLAGLPASVTARAHAVLEALERDGGGRRTASIVDDLPLFSALARHAPVAAAPGPSALEQGFADLNPDDLTPREALEALYRLKGLAEPKSE